MSQMSPYDAASNICQALPSLWASSTVPQRSSGSSAAPCRRVIQDKHSKRDWSMT